MSEPPALAVPGLAIAALSLGAFGAAASARVADPMLPALATGYGVGIGTAANVVTLFTLAYGVFQIVLGPFGDRYGKYRVIGWACATSAATALGCALAPTFGTLTVARFVAGATCAAIVPLSMAWIGDVLPYERRQPVLARFLIGQMLGFSGGKARALADVPIHFRVDDMQIAEDAQMIVGHMLLQWLHGQRDEVNGYRSALTAASAFELDWVLDRDGFHNLRFELDEENPHYFQQLPGQPPVTQPGPVSSIATHLHRHYGISLSFAGTLVMLYGAGGILFAALSTILVRRLGEAGLATTGGLLICAMLIAIDATERWPLAALAVLVMGTGFYMLHNTLQTNATQMAPEKRGTAVSQFAFCLFVGQSVGVALAGLIAERADTDAVLAAGGFGVLAVALAFAQLRRTRHRRVEVSA